MISIEQKAPPGDRIAAEWNDVANATRRRRRILQSRILFYSTGKLDGTSLLNKKALRANDAHSREDEDRRERPRSSRECAEAHSFLGLYKLYEILTDVSWGKYGMRVILIDKLNTYENWRGIDPDRRPDPVCGSCRRQKDLV